MNHLTGHDTKKMKMTNCSSEPSPQKMSDFCDMQILQVRRTEGQLMVLFDPTNRNEAGLEGS